MPLAYTSLTGESMTLMSLMREDWDVYASSHCACVYYQDWHRTKKPKPAVEGGIMPGVSRSVTTIPATATRPTSLQDTHLQPQPNFSSPRNTLTTNSGVTIAYNECQSPVGTPSGQNQASSTSTGLPFDEEAKLVYGVVISLRNMIRKLSGKFVLLSLHALFVQWESWRRDENFVSYKTSTYSLHLLETPSGYKFILLSDPNTDSMKFVLRQIYSGPFIEYVARNPLMDMDSKEHGIDNEHFRNAVDRLMRNLSVFNWWDRQEAW